MEADRLELIARHKFAPSNRPRLFARPMRVQIVLGAGRYPAWFTHGRWPVPFRYTYCKVGRRTDPAGMPAAGWAFVAAASGLLKRA